ncbi:MAG TPA: DNA-processing protein DprA [Candidatus Subteraquimicrobiales bacterium]
MDEKYWVGLKLIPPITQKFNQFLRQFGGAKEIWEASLSELSQVVSLEVAQKIVFQRNQVNLGEELERVKNHGARVLTVNSPEYPTLLQEIPSPPAALFITGKNLKDFSPAIAIVGSRRASTYGKALAEEFAAKLSEAGLTIVSGLARGIDSAAHLGALRTGGETVGVLGCGLDVVYPAENKKLYQQISEEGALVSEYPLGTPPLTFHFPSRNRIISGLSLGVIVVEANDRSGALITVDFALEQGREVFAVPGNVKSTLSRGTHKLLKQGASLVEKAEDVLEALNISSPEISVRKESNQSDLSRDEKSLLERVGWEVRHIDEICRQVNQPISQTSSLLTILELKGYIKQEAGQRYLRIQ